MKPLKNLFAELDSMLAALAALALWCLWMASQ